MASKTVSVVTGGANQAATNNTELNAFATDFLSSGITGGLTNTLGVAPSLGGYAINAQGSPNMTVRVSAGILWQLAIPSGQLQQSIRVFMNTFEDVTIAANASGATRWDFIYMKLDQVILANPGVNKDDVATLVVSRSSTSATVDNGTPPTAGQLLAVVTVANGAVTITNGNITDKRVSAAVQSLSLGTMYNPIKFSAYAGVTTSLPTSTWTKATINTVAFDTHNDFNISLNRFVVPVSGFYFINGQAAVTQAGSSANGQANALYKNGVLLISGTQLVASGNGFTINRSNLSTLVQLVAGDYIEVFAFMSDPTGRLIDSGSVNTYLSGFLVSTT